MNLLADPIYKMLFMSALPEAFLKVYVPYVLGYTLKILNMSLELNHSSSESQLQGILNFKMLHNIKNYLMKGIN